MLCVTTAPHYSETLCHHSTVCNGAAKSASCSETRLSLFSCSSVACSAVVGQYRVTSPSCITTTPLSSVVVSCRIKTDQIPPFISSPLFSLLSFRVHLPCYNRPSISFFPYPDDREWNGCITIGRRERKRWKRQEEGGRGGDQWPSAGGKRPPSVLLPCQTALPHN